MLKLTDPRLPRNLYLNEGSVPVASVSRGAENAAMSKGRYRAGC